MPSWRFRTKPGFAGPGGTFSAAGEAEGAQESVRELEGRSAAESASSSGVGRRPIARVRTRLEGGGSPDRGLLDMFGGLDEAN
jgi:hypothetical protein